MRDLVVREALQAMARDAARRFRELVAAGEEIPYEVREPGEASALAEYAPLTERFVREHAVVLRDLDSFGAACAAIESAGLATPYLEQFGVGVPAEPRDRADLAATVFLCRLWLDSTDFSLDAERLSVAVDELQRNADAGQGEIQVIVPLRGLQMPAARLELGETSIVRADTVEVPAEARSPEGSGLAGWEPAFLAVTSVPADIDGEADRDPGAVAVERLRALVTTLRLYKPGAVALGSHAWTRIGSDRWRRISTGAARGRPGGYRLSEGELQGVAAFARAVAGPATPFSRSREATSGFPAVLARSLSRFEAGLERLVVLEALNDHLLALRFLLEGGGPADLGLSMRVASLCAEPDRRSDTKGIIDGAIALERELWSGEPAPTGDARTPAQIAGEVEDLLRAILKDAACGHLGTDLRATADEILLADGLAVGEGSDLHRGATAEWDLGDVEEHVELDEVEPEDPAPAPVEEPPALQNPELWLDADDAFAEEPTETLKVPEPEGRIQVEQVPRRKEEKVYANGRPDEITAPSEARPLHPVADASPVARLLAERAEQREAIADRVAHLFPRPETTEWNVREIGYDRTRRARVQEASR